MQPLLLPSTVVFEEGDRPTMGKMIVEPCESGYGTTLGNALRRVLLSSLPGAAVTDIKIDSVQHEFSTVDGVKEDVVEIMMNVKKIRMKVHTEEPVRLSLSASGVKTVTAADIAPNADVEIANPNLVLATLTDGKASFTMELIAAAGRGYDPIEGRDRSNAEIGLLAVDALFSPMRNVGFTVENTRVGQMTNYDRLVLSIETDGTIDARSAVEQSTKILMDHFRLFLNPKDAKAYEGGGTEQESVTEEPEEIAAAEDEE